MIKNYSDILCMECKEVIYNPLCPSCLARDIGVWLDKKPKLKAVLEKDMNKILEQGKHLDSMKCIACNKNSAFLCPYCFTEKIYEKLKEIKAGKKILSEFIVLFDFEHSGYYKDAEKLGAV